MPCERVLVQRHKPISLHGLEKHSDLRSVRRPLRHRRAPVRHRRRDHAARRRRTRRFRDRIVRWRRRRRRGRPSRPAAVWQGPTTLHRCASTFENLERLVLLPHFLFANDTLVHSRRSTTRIVVQQGRIVLRWRHTQRRHCIRQASRRLVIRRASVVLIIRVRRRRRHTLAPERAHQRRAIHLHPHTLWGDARRARRATYACHVAYGYDAASRAARSGAYRTNW